MNKLIIFWGWFKPALLKFLQKELVKKLLLKVVGSAYVGGIYLWVANYLVNIGMERVIEPVVELLVRKGFLIVEKTSGKIAFKRLQKAKDENDEDTYVDIIIDV